MTCVYNSDSLTRIQIPTSSSSFSSLKEAMASLRSAVIFLQSAETSLHSAISFLPPPKKRKVEIGINGFDIDNIDRKGPIQKMIPHTDPSKVIRFICIENAHTGRIVWADLRKDGILETADINNIHKFWSLNERRDTLRLEQMQISSQKIESRVCHIQNTNTPTNNTRRVVVCCSQTTPINSQINHLYPCYFEVTPLIQSIPKYLSEKRECIHSDTINCISTSASGHYIVSGDASGIIKIWSGHGDPIFSINRRLSGIGGVVISQNGCIVVAWCKESRALHIYDITNDDSKILALLTFAHKRDPTSPFYIHRLGSGPFQTILYYAGLLY